MKDVAELFLARAEWWFKDHPLHDELLEGIFWHHTGSLDNMRIDAGFPINVDPEHKISFSEVCKLHTWIDLFMWKLSGGDL